MAPSNQLFKKNKGSLLVEIIIAIGLFALISPAIISGLIATHQGEPQQQQRLQALALVKETQESLRTIREKGWSAFSTNGIYYPTISGNTWTLVSGTETNGDFTRSVTVADTYRNNGDIGSSGTIDPSTKKITITVNWQQPTPSSVSTVLYFTRYLDNLSYTETTVADFSGGTNVGTTITNTNGGEVILGSGGRVDWCAPNLTINALDLPGQAYASDISAYQGRAYVTTGGNSSGDSMDRIDIADTNPPVAVNSGAYTNFKTYSIFATPSFIYLTSDHPGLTVDIVNPATLTHAGYFNPSSGGKGNSVFVDGTIGYVTVGNQLFTFDVSAISGNNQTQLGSITLAGNGEKVIVANGYAYIAISGSATMLQVVSSTNGGRNLAIIGQANLDSLSAKSVAINTLGSRAYVVTGNSSTKNELFIVDTHDKSGTSSNPISYPTISSYNSNGMDPNGVVVVAGNKVIVVGSGGEQYQVINISNEVTPVRCGGLSNPNGASAINAIATVVEADSDSYAYILTNNSSKEFQIIEGGPGGAISQTGTFTSKIFDAGHETAFNRFQANADVPVNTQISYQVAVADAVNNSCANANYVFVNPGPGNTIPFSSDIVGYKNPSRCFRYKVNFSSTDPSQTPVFNDITINYSP